MTPNERRYALIGWIWVAGLAANALGGLLFILFAPVMIPYIGGAVLLICTIGTLLVDDADGVRLTAALALQAVLMWLSLGRASILLSLPVPFVAGVLAVVGARRRAHHSTGTT